MPMLNFFAIVTVLLVRVAWCSEGANGGGGGRMGPKCAPPEIAEPNLERADADVDLRKVCTKLVNIARGKSVASNDEPVGGVLSFVTDGVTDFGFTNAVMLVTADASVLPWIEIDLGEILPLRAVQIWHRDETNATPFCFRDVIVQVSRTNRFTKADIVFNNDFNNSSGFGCGTNRPYVESPGGKTILFPHARAARYVRVYSSRNCWGSSDVSWFTEVKVLCATNVLDRTHME